MNRLPLAIFCCLFWCMVMPWSACGASPQTNAVHVLRSRSGQFIVHGVPLEEKNQPQYSQLPAGSIRVDPAFLAVSCERIKAAFLAQLGLKDAWKGKIHLFIKFTRIRQKPIDIYPFHYREGWQYHLMVPDEIDSVRLARAVIQVLLLELANRNAGPRMSEVPLWLSEGLLHHLMANSEKDLILLPFSKIARFEERRIAWDKLKEQLKNRTPLTFNQLSLPTPDYLKGDAWETYQSSAHLFVHELFTLPQGGRSLVVFLQQLPAVLNWQTSFLAAFRDQFTRLLDVEKWWAVSLVNFNHGRKLHGWSEEETLTRLDEILNSAAQIRQVSQDLPVPARLSLQRLIEFWDYPVQKNILRVKINQLSVLQVFSAPSLVDFSIQYRDALNRYLEVCDRAGLDPAIRGRPAISARPYIRQTIQRLDELDNQRQLIHHQMTSQVSRKN